MTPQRRGREAASPTSLLPPPWNRYAKAAVQRGSALHAAEWRGSAADAAV
ncbi:hypothetical protein GCM10010172_85750 [Paractinoplanes ferrugineus]|uniref:Uncharacterized protein n=1 Tax=Paractinoplanes ferrugineus TaxID=113564 RepID=A0A919IWK3_9ACTN|nr:hypothetical protein Afe05nite_09820 [Actinoplanes ferrugineus]